MQTNCAHDRRLGISFVELLCATAVLSMVTVVTIARLNIGADVNQARCTHHLKETGLAFRLFTNDNADRFPTQVSQTFGGAREAAAAGRIAGIFAVLADYQAKPEHAVCPGDTRSAALAMPVVTPANLSYFVNLDAAPAAEPAAVLLGDRDLKPAGAGRGEANWIMGTHRLHARQPALEWSGVLHRAAGNLAMADGTVRRVDAGALPKVLSPATAATERWLFPQ